MARTKNEKYRVWLEKGIDHMTQKKFRYPTPQHEEADRLLAKWREAKKEVEEIKAQAAEALNEVAAVWAKKIAPAEVKLAALRVGIEDLEKEHRVGFFGEGGAAPVSCSVDLPQGTLLYDKTEYVVKPRKVDVLANLERYGFEEAIRRDPAVDWDVLNDPQEWPDEVLAIIGTRREVKETYGFQVKEES